MPRPWPALKRAVAEFKDDNLTDWAAALTYYGLLSLFPGLIALVSIVGLVGDPRGATQTITEIVTAIGPQSAAQTFAGPVVDAVAEPLGVGSTAVTVWNLAKWPAMAAVFVLMVGVLYYASPSAKIRGFRWVTPGSLVAIVIWAIASVGFALYVTNFGSYDKTYGTLAGLVALLVWLWISNLAILFGHELNAELERGGGDRGKHARGRARDPARTPGRFREGVAGEGGATPWPRRSHAVPRAHPRRTPR